jgi:hypothetical protein
MNKYILPSAAAFLILVVAFSSVSPAMAVTRIVLAPELKIVTIPEDDQVRNTGVMILGVGPTGTPANQMVAKLYSQFKIIVTLNGLIVSTAGLVFVCNVAEKDKVYIPPGTATGKTPTTPRQFPEEFIKTSVKDVASDFVCKFRPKSIYVPPAYNNVGQQLTGTGVWTSEGLAVGVLDVYYTGPGDWSFIADHILVVEAMYTVGRQVFYGAEIQDICILGYSQTAYGTLTTLADGTPFPIYVNPLLNFQSCDSAALSELIAMGHWP